MEVPRDDKNQPYTLLLGLLSCHGTVTKRYLNKGILSPIGFIFDMEVP